MEALVTIPAGLSECFYKFLNTLGHFLNIQIEFEWSR